ncbi:hypothetical protein ENBRE01_1318 [Enteropsectra breve]|nr:hypothetical protein ENBRE01_1318 [Enteropsectra breve]
MDYNALIIPAGGTAIALCIGALLYMMWKDYNKIYNDMLSIYIALSATDEMKEFFRTKEFFPYQILSKAMKLVQMQHEDGYSLSSEDKKAVKEGFNVLFPTKYEGLSAKIFKKVLDQLHYEHDLSAKNIFDMFSTAFQIETHLFVNMTMDEYCRYDKGPALHTENSTIRMIDNTIADVSADKQGNLILNIHAKYSYNVWATTKHERNYDKTVTVLELGELILIKIPAWITKNHSGNINVAPSCIPWNKGKYDYSGKSYNLVASLEFKKSWFPSDNSLLVTKAEPTTGMRISTSSKAELFLLLRAA